MSNYQEQLQTHLPGIEEFLTSLLLEETQITIAAYDPKDTEGFEESLQKNDIVLYARDEEAEMDFFGILDEEWFGLLSSVMLGVEEKKFNEVTKDLLKKFSSELSVTLKKKLDEDDNPHNFGEVEVYQVGDLADLMNHTNYFFAELEVEGIADESVRAAFAIGDPEARIEPEIPEEDVEEEAAAEETSESEQETPNEEDEDKDFEQGLNNGRSGKNGREEEVISAKYVKFEDFEETPPHLENEAGNSMDLLKDVEMDVSVELGRIQLPLGKVLQLAKGSVVELEKLAGEPVDILVNGQRIAHGEVVVIDEHFGVRISNLITTKQRIAKLS